VVISRKGASGGYGLRIPAEELSILKIVSAIDGELAISKCLSDDYCCSRNPDKDKCRMHRVFCYLNRELAQKLDRLTVADIASGDRELPELIDKINGKNF
jgi:Rrf2 family protein